MCVEEHTEQLQVEIMIFFNSERSQINHINSFNVVTLFKFPPKLHPMKKTLFALFVCLFCPTESVCFRCNVPTERWRDSYHTCLNNGCLLFHSTMWRGVNPNPNLSSVSALVNQHVVETNLHRCSTYSALHCSIRTSWCSWCAWWTKRVKRPVSSRSCDGRRKRRRKGWTSSLSLFYHAALQFH